MAVNANTFQELRPQIEDFLMVTNLLPVDPISDTMLTVYHPGEEIGSTQLLSVLPKLSYANKLMLLSHLILNDMFGIKTLTMYDWGYWIDTDSNKHIIPFGTKHGKQVDEHLLEPYTLCGMPPTISTLGGCVSDWCLSYVKEKFIYAIELYQKSIQIYAPRNILAWSAFDKILRNGSRDLQQFIR